jgi:ancient ubiquitous protein 1
VFYAPIGLFLTLLRVCMSLQAVLILLLFPEGAVKRFLLRVFFGVLGIVVVTDSFHRKGSQTKVFLSNKLSYVDHIALHLALDCITVSCGRRAPPLYFLFPHHCLSSSSEEDLETEAKKLPEFDESRSVEKVSPLVFQPEPMPTNGSYSLLQFSTWPCSLARNIQPIALTAKRPFGITLSTVQSSQWWDLFWTLFVPVTVFRVKLLPPMERREGEEANELCERAQDSLREELKLRRSEITLDDITTWLEARKKKPLSPPTSDPPPASSSLNQPSSTAPVHNDNMERMVRQVSAVMPQVPHSAIMTDLLRTMSVDATITNILEGIVAYDALPPEPPKSQTTPTATPSVLSSSSPPLKSGDLRPRKYYSAAMEAMHRQLSLNERKQQLLEKARRQYIKKYGLNVDL